MKVVVTGGGTGGHVTPIRAVVSALKTLEPKSEIHYIGSYGDRFAQLVGDSGVNQQHRILAGKLRRYHGVSLWRQLIDIPTLLLNIRDLFYIFIGFWQSLFLLLRIRPSVVFVKGGYVGLPVGLAAAILRRPIITHDSDALPGLTNRVIGRYARLNAISAPPEYYAYDASKTRYVGVPVSEEYQQITATKQTQLKRRLGLQTDQPLVVVTGGSLGAGKINDAVLSILPNLIEQAHVVHISGDTTYEDVKARATETVGDSKAYELMTFTNELAVYAGAADVIVTRGGASSLAELALLAKPVIVVPNPRLTGGHQVKNAAVLDEAEATVVISEHELEHRPEVLLETITELLDNADKRVHLSEKLHEFAKPDAAQDIAKLIQETAKTNGT